MGWCSNHNISGQISYQAKLQSRTLKKNYLHAERPLFDLLAHTYFKHDVKKAQRRLILIRVWSWGNVRWPPADQFQGALEFALSWRRAAWDEINSPGFIMSSYSQGHLIMALFIFFKAPDTLREQLKEEFLLFHYSTGHMSKRNGQQGPKE